MRFRQKSYVVKTDILHDIAIMTIKGNPGVTEVSKELLIPEFPGAFMRTLLNQQHLVTRRANRRTGYVKGELVITWRKGTEEIVTALQDDSSVTVDGVRLVYVHGKRDVIVSLCIRYRYTIQELNSAKTNIVQQQKVTKPPGQEDMKMYRLKIEELERKLAAETSRADAQRDVSLHMRGELEQQKATTTKTLSDKEREIIKMEGAIESLERQLKAATLASREYHAKATFLQEALTGRAMLGKHLRPGLLHMY
jgi:hypothetical protein